MAGTMCNDPNIPYQTEPHDMAGTIFKHFMQMKSNAVTQELYGVCADEEVNKGRLVRSKRELRNQTNVFESGFHPLQTKLAQPNLINVLETHEVPICIGTQSVINSKLSEKIKD